MDREKVITGLELCTNISPDGCLMLCPYKDEKDETYSWFCEQVLKQDALAFLKEQDELIKAMKRDLDLVRSCKVCGNWTECTPDAPPESPEFKMWRDCGGSCKFNWKWRGI